ncbi:serine/threonine-protein kinase [Photobacterium phosphoreum]|uniref:serine/threonine-protein kinase n=1 Tax=Photobacterium phosphoreum TaxID=659 RepID=UPI00242F23FA|nr:serine/threonine-protein kinase [Photobacterium phosphoreum]
MNKLHQPNDLICNRYYIKKYLAEGGMQQVFEAFDSNLERYVALKTPKNSSASIRFKQSAVCSAKVIHPNVARTLDYFNYEGREYLIEELIIGSDLNEIFLNNFYYLDPCSVAHIGHLLAKAVSASHRVNVIHRDLKPSNIMIIGGRLLKDIKVTDFGIAKMVDDELKIFSEDDVESSIAGSKTLVGAIPYMAPEVVLNEAPVGKYSDIWSIGAILYHLLSGERPFSAQFTKIVVKYYKKETPPLISNINTAKQLSSLSQELMGIIDLCLNYSHNERPTADQLVLLFSELCYSTAERKFGEIKYKKSDTSWGFIKNTGNEPDTFYHTEEVYGDQPCFGETVCFSEYPGAPKSRAFPILRCK